MSSPDDLDAAEGECREVLDSGFHCYECGLTEHIGPVLNDLDSLRARLSEVECAHGDEEGADDRAIDDPLKVWRCRGCGRLSSRVKVGHVSYVVAPEVAARLSEVEGERDEALVAIDTYVAACAVAEGRAERDAALERAEKAAGIIAADGRARERDRRRITDLEDRLAQVIEAGNAVYQAHDFGASPVKRTEALANWRRITEGEGT